MTSNRASRVGVGLVSDIERRAGGSRFHRLRAGVTLAATTLLVGAGIVPAQAGVVDKGTDDLYVVTDHTDFCGIPEFSVQEVMDATVRFLLVAHGPEGVPYWISTAHGTQTWTNPATGASVSKVFNILDRDLVVTDNGDGTLTVLTLATGGERWYGPDGKLLFRNPGQVRLEYLVDTNGDWHFIGVVKGSTGRNDSEGRDFCEDMETYLGN